MYFDPKSMSYSNLLMEKLVFSSDLKTANIKLKPQVFWNANQVFTAAKYESFFNLIKSSPEIKHPIKINFQGVDLKTVNNQEIQLNLSAPYFPFLYNLTFPIVDNLAPNQTNFCGPYLVTKINKTQFGQDLSLIKNPNYKLSNPIFDKIIIKIYRNESSLIKHFNQGKISIVISSEYTNNFKLLKHARLLPTKNGTVYLTIFNLENDKLKDKTTRRYLNQLVDKRKILNQTFAGYGNIIEAPLNTEFYQISKSKTQPLTNFNPSAVKIPKSLRLAYPQTQIFTQISKIIKRDFEKAGIQVSLEPLALKDGFVEALKNKDYELILIGQNYIYPPDPYSFWSSSQIKFPGQNMANLANPDIDSILDKIRTTNNIDAIKTLAQEFNSLMQNELPAIFIFSPDYITITDKRIHFPDRLRANYPEEIINSIL